MSTDRRAADTCSKVVDGYPGLTGFARRLLDLASVSAGERVLDVGCDAEAAPRRPHVP